ncbi:MAG: hypothetical protein ACFFD4_25520 [Candidatus Odinarchaeota archaeon]
MSGSKINKTSISKKVEKVKGANKEQVVKAKKILLRVSDNLYEAIEKAIQMGIADNASEFVRRSVVNQLLALNLLGLPEEKER